MDKEMVVFGGKNQEGESMSELMVLSTEKLSWTKPRTIGEAPSARSSHSATFVRDSIFIHGILF